MQPLHPHRLRASIYFVIPLLLVVVFLVSGLHGAHLPDQNSHAAHFYGTMSGVALLLTVIFIIPFWIYAVKYWLERYHPQTLPPADDQAHLVKVTYSTGYMFKYLLGPYLGRSGQLSWVNAGQNIKLVRGDAVVFDVAYKDVQKIELNINQLVLKVNGRYYNFYANSMLVAAGVAATAAASVERALMKSTPSSELAGAAAVATMAAGWEKLEQAGVTELAERMRLVGVKVIITRVGRAVEYGFDFGFLFVCIVSLLLIILVH